MLPNLDGYFDKYAEEYYEQDRYNYFWYRWAIDKLVEMVDAETGQSILDLGTGHGIVPIKLTEDVGEEGEIIGVDASEEMIEKGKEDIEELGYGNIEFVVSYIEELNFDSESFDAVVSTFALDHVDDKTGLAEDIYNWLKPGGKFIIALPFLVDENFEEMIRRKERKHPDKARKYRESLEETSGNTSEGYLEEHPEEFNVTLTEFIKILESAGFSEIEVVPPYAKMFKEKGCAVVVGGK